MNGFEDWGNREWVRFLFALGIAALGLVIAAAAPFMTPRDARKAGQVDAGGKPVDARGHGPATFVGWGLLIAAGGGLFALYQLHKGGVL